MVESKAQAPSETTQSPSTAGTDTVQVQRSPSPIGEAPGLSDMNGQMQHQQDTTQESHFNVVREDDRRRWALGEHPGPDWNDDEAMKAWLDQRFPQGTTAGSPYYQFMVTAFCLEDTYWLPGRGSKHVLSKFSESEWKRWQKEMAGLVMHAKWGEKPLYPDAKKVKVNVQKTSKPLEKASMKLPSSKSALQADQIRKLLGKGLLARKEGRLNVSSSGKEKAKSPILGASEDTELEFGDVAAAKFLDRFPIPAKSSPRLMSSTDGAGTLKKRTAADAEIDMSEFPVAKKIKQSPEVSPSFEKASTWPFVPRLCANGASREAEYGQRQSKSPPQDRDTEMAALQSQSGLARGEAHCEKVSELISPSNPQVLETLDEAKADADSIMSDVESAKEEGDPGFGGDHRGEKFSDLTTPSKSEGLEAVEEAKADEDSVMSDAGSAKEEGQPDFGGAIDEDQFAQEDSTGILHKYTPVNEAQQIVQAMIHSSPQATPQPPSETREEQLHQREKRENTSETNLSEAADQDHAQPENQTGIPQESTPANQAQQTIQVVIPASPQLPPQPSEKRKERLQQRKKRRVTSETPGQATPYTTEHLRSGIRNRRHTLPNLVRLEMKGRREVQVPGCFRY